MKILAEFNGERVILVNIRDNGTCDVVRTVYDEKTESDSGILLLANKKDLKIVDSEFLIDSLQEHLRQLQRNADKKKTEELTKREKELLKQISETNTVKAQAYKKEIF